MSNSNESKLMADMRRVADYASEMQQLRSTEAHILQMLESETDDAERDILEAKYRRTQARRRELSGAP